MFTADGEQLAELRGHDAQVKSVTISRDEQRVLTASDDGTARLWQINGQLLTTFKGHTAQVNNAVFSPDERRVLTSSSDGTVQQFLVDVPDLLKAASRRVGRQLVAEEIKQFQIPTPLRFDFARYV